MRASGTSLRFFLPVVVRMAGFANTKKCHQVLLLLHILKRCGGCAVCFFCKFFKTGELLSAAAWMVGTVQKRAAKNAQGPLCGRAFWEDFYPLFSV